MDANPITARRRRTGTRVLAAAGLAALAVGVAGTAPGQTPAATLKAPRPLEPAVGRLVARGASPSPSFAAFETPRPAAPVTLSPSGRSPGWLTGPSPIPPPSAVHTPPSLTPVSAVLRAEPKKHSYLGRKWDDVKEFFGGPPPVVPLVPAPRPTHPGPAAAAAAAGTVPPATGPAAPTAPTATGGVYAGPPAYRWYGWGTTTPGANPYAPTGQSPRGSATWYAQSGATPGAFPVPVMNPPRPEPGVESPAYTTPGGAFARQEPLVRPASGRTVTPTPPAASTPSPAPERVIAPVPVFNPIPTTAYPPPPEMGPGVTVPVPPRFVTPQTRSSADQWVPIAQSTPGAGLVQAAAVAPPAGDAVVRALSLTPANQPVPRPPVAGLTWRSVRDGGDVRFASAGDAGLVQNPPAATTSAGPHGQRGSVRKPADADARLAAPPWVTRGQQPPAADGPSLDHGIRNACYGRAIVTEVRHTGPSSLLVRLTAPSDADGQSAARAVSRLPQLLDYDVRFELTLSRR